MTLTKSQKAERYPQGYWQMVFNRAAEIMDAKPYQVDGKTAYNLARNDIDALLDGYRRQRNFDFIRI